MGIRTVGLCAFAAAALAITPAAAQQCAVRKVTATGATVMFQFLARASALTAWSDKVRRERVLGAGYAAWLRAEDKRTVCRRIGSRHVCLASAVPCKPTRVAAGGPPLAPAGRMQ